MNRRGFLGAMLAACAAPAYVRAGSLMRLAAPVITLDTVIPIGYIDMQRQINGRMQLVREMVMLHALGVAAGSVEIVRYGEDWQLLHGTQRIQQGLE